MISNVSAVQNGLFVSLWDSSLNTALTDEQFEENLLPNEDGTLAPQLTDASP
jgi:hypothetical protein